MERTDFAVEVTQIQQQIQLHPRSYSEAAVSAALSSTLDGMKERALSEGLIAGFYRVHMQPLPFLANIAPEIERRLRAFLIATRHLSITEKCFLWNRGWPRQ